MQIRVLSASDIVQALSMVDAIDVNAQAYAMFSAGEVKMPRRLSIETAQGVTLFMPAYLPSTDALAVKAISIYNENPKKGLPTVHAMVLVLDNETGRPLALMDGTRLTALRTGAGAGAATRLLAREDSRVLAMFGAGGLAMDQVEAVLSVRPIEEVRIYTPSGSSARNLANRLSQQHSNLVAHAVNSPAQAVHGADIISCITTSRTPVFDPADVASGTHINGIGSFMPDVREVQVVGLPNLRVFVDSKEATLEEAGDLIQAIAEGFIQPEDLTEIGKVILGKAPGRTSPDEVTFFKSVGMAVQDAATAQAVLARAMKMGLGIEVEV
jgi:ornithine cyclodeaminase/alanine dehydrogenase-like protein (mu-crystallin family)